MADPLSSYLAGVVNSKGDIPALRDKLLKRVGAPTAASPKFLGRGAKGTAFDVSGNVLKLTNDTTEVDAMSIVREKPSKYIVKVYDVFRISPTYVTPPIYGIYQERVLKPDRGWAVFANEIRTAVLGPKGTNFITTATVAKFVQSYYDEIEYDESYLPMFTDERIAWLIGVTKYLESAGIKFRDFHEGNLMKRKNGDHVLIDLGWSQSKGGHVDLLASARARLNNLAE